MQNTKFNFIDFEKIKEEKKKQQALDVNSFDKQLSSIMTGLEAMDQDMSANHMPKISESAFKKHFLKAFAGIGDIQDIIATYNTWLLEVAKSPGIPVNVCDDNDHDKTLFVVPALGNNSSINPEKTNSKKVYEAISLANDARFLRPFDWEQILSNNLDNVLLEIYDKTKVKNTEDSAKWNFIFTKYKDILLLEKDNNSETTSNSETKDVFNNKNTAITYDEVDEPI